MLEAKITNRTLVLPSFIYARQCAVEQWVVLAFVDIRPTTNVCDSRTNLTSTFFRSACAAFAAQSRRSEEIGKGDYYYLSEDEQQTWRLPIGLMVDIPQLRENVSVITVGEYLRYHHLPPSLERLDGHWDMNKYRTLPDFANTPARNLSIVTLWSKDYEPDDIVRVDSLPRGPKALPNVEDRPIYKAIKERLNGHKTVFLDEAKRVLRDQNLGTWNNDGELNDLLMENGWGIVHTFEGV